MAGMVPPGTTSYNWLRQKQIAQVSQVTGLQLTARPASSPSAICGRQIDSSVAVGGAGDIPITPNSINPASLQNSSNEFVAPIFAPIVGNPNLLVNPTARFNYDEWTVYDFHSPATYGSEGEAFRMSCSGASSIDSGMVQFGPVLLGAYTPGSTMTISGVVEVTEVTNGYVYVDIFDSNIGYVITPVNINVPQAPTYFSASFTVPADGSVVVRCRIYNATNGAIQCAFSQLKLEEGPTATPFSYGAFDGLAEVDITGALHSILVSIGFVNIPTNTNGEPAAVAICWYMKNTNSSVWIPWAQTPIPGVPYPLQSQVLTFGYGQLALGVEYDFAAAFVDVNGNIGPIGQFAEAFNPNTSIFQVSSSYMLSFGGSFAPQFSSTPNLSTPLSANGISSAVTMTFTIANQPTDGSLSRVSVWYRVTPPGGSGTSQSSSPFTFYGSVPAIGVGLPLVSLPTNGTYTFTFTDLTNGTPYDFAVSCEDTAGGETEIVYATSFTAQTYILPVNAFPAHPTDLYILATGTSVQTQGSAGQPSYYSTLTIYITLLNGPGGSAVSSEPWLSQINILAKPISGTTSDFDLVALDYIACANPIFGSTINNPIEVYAGPFPATSNQEIAIQLIDQAGNPSNAAPFIITVPPGPNFNSSGQLQYTSFGDPITALITPTGTLVNGVVGRAQIATPATGNNLLFNPTAGIGLLLAGINPTLYWNVINGQGGAINVTSDTFNGGRFRMYYLGGQNQDSALYQTLSNLAPGILMVMSGILEIDTLTGNGTYAGIDIFDPVTNSVVTGMYLTATQPATYFEFRFSVPQSGAFEVRMRIGNNNSGGANNAYWSKLQCEHGTVASPYNDAMTAAAVANTHTPAGQLIVVSNTVSGGTIDYNATPSSITSVITSSGTYNVSLPTAGLELPYSSNNGAFTIATGPDGQMTNAYFFSGVVPTGTAASVQNNIVLPLGGTYQFFVSLNAFTTNAGLELKTFIASGATPAGYTSAYGMNVVSPSLTGANPVAGSFICSGGQTISIGFYLTATNGLTAPAIFSIESYKIT